jgi:16S rRNA processing protein RimM
MPDDRSSAPVAVTPELVRVAHVRRVHGLRGEVRVQALGGDRARFAPGTQLLGERGRRHLTVASSRPLDGDELLLAFEELPGRDQATVLSGDYLCVHPSQARTLGDDEWFVWQLVGLRAVTADGEQLGVVRDVEEQPSSDVIVVAHGGAEQRYPLVRQWISSVDPAAGVVVVTPWPEDDG